MTKHNNESQLQAEKNDFSEVEELKAQLKAAQNAIVQLQAEKNRASVPAAIGNQGRYPESTEKRIVLDHGIGYTKFVSDRLEPIESRPAQRGEELLFTPDQVERLEALGVIGSEEDLKARIAAENNEVPEQKLEDLDQIGMLAYLANTNDRNELDRVERLENNRATGPRKEVLDTVDFVRNALDTIENQSKKDDPEVQQIA